MFKQINEVGWGDEEEYYNDQPGAIPPSPTSPFDPPQYTKVSQLKKSCSHCELGVAMMIV